MKLNFLFWFYLITGLCIWGAIPFMLFKNSLIIALSCWYIWNRWGGYVGAWFINEREKENSTVKKDDEIDFRDL